MKNIPFVSTKYKIRFFQNLNITKNCWEWKASKTNFGYGQFTINNKIYRSHRVSWKIFFGDVPKNKMILHKCDNPSRVNPRHLFIGNDIDNIHDRDNKGRTSLGSKHPKTKLSVQNVKEIRKLANIEYCTQKELAKRFNVSHSNISSIVNYKTWKKLK